MLPNGPTLLVDSKRLGNPNEAGRQKLLSNFVFSKKSEKFFYNMFTDYSHHRFMVIIFCLALKILSARERKGNICHL